ncbi:MAG: protein kinase [Bacteroidetes bacterium]|nr:protein kinase [Bacteroidota bacterium]
MATVYLAEDVKHHRKIALKVLRPELSAALGPERFLREIKITAKLTHPHILPVHDSGQADGFLYYVMPYVEGESLRERLNSEKQLPLDDSLRIAREVADALSYAHSHDVVHRDIKPENILLESGHAVVADFGIARAITVAGGEKLTETGIAVGTPSYMSPEQASGEHQLGGRSDIYSLGCVLYEMLAGEPPYTGATPQAILARKSVEAVPSLRTVRETVPDVIEEAVLKALAKVPADRFSSAAQFVEALQVPSGEFTPAKTRPGVLRLAGKPRGRLVLLAATVAVVVGGALLIRTPATHTLDADLPRLVVLPARNLGGPEAAYFADGLSEELSARLTALSQLEVIGRMSAERYRDTDLTPEQIGAELNADYILGLRVHGGALASSGEVRVSAELVRSSTAAQLWAGSYTAAQMDGLLDLMSDVATNVAGELGLSLGDQEQQLLSARPTDNQEAYDYYLRGSAVLRRSFDPADLREAADLFSRAVALDGSFTLAWVGLGRAHTEIYRFRGDRRAERLEMAREALDSAMALDADLAELRLALGIYHYHGFLDYDRALEELAVAQRSAPNNHQVHGWAGAVYRRQGEFELAISSFERALELDPGSHIVAAELGVTLTGTGRFSEARSSSQLAISLYPQFTEAYRDLAVGHMLEGNLAEAAAILRRAVDRNTILEVVRYWYLVLLLDGDLQDAVAALQLTEQVADTGSYYLTRAFARRARGDAEGARVLFESAAASLIQRARVTQDDYFTYSNLGIAYAGAGHRELALQAGRRAVEILPLERDRWAGPDMLVALGNIYLLLGDVEGAAEQYQRVVTLPSLGAFYRAWLRHHPFYEPFRADPRFQRLLEE